MSVFTDLQLRTIEHLIRRWQAPKATAFGTMVTRDTTGPWGTARTDDSSTPVPVRVPTGVHAFDGDRVLMALLDGRWCVTESFGTRSLGESSWRQSPTTAGSYSGASYADIPEAVSMPFTKRYDDTAVFFSLTFSMYIMTTGNTQVKTAMRIVSTEPGGYSADVPVGRLFINDVSKHFPVPGTARWVGPPAGTYTITPRWLREQGTGVLWMDQNNTIVMDADEIYRTG